MVEISSPDKILFPTVGLTKADLVDYYQAMAHDLLVGLVDRPLTLQRFPRGVGAKGFMQKNAGDHFPQSIRRLEVPKQGGVTRYPIVTQADDIVWLANQNTITFHVWTARVGMGPDWLVIDLDPPDGSDPAPVRAAAAATRTVLARFGLDATLVATGSKGFHLWVRTGKRPGNDLSLATRALAGLVAAAEPDLATTEFLKLDRGDRVFVDWLRARPGSTIVAPLSVRATPTATVAVPVGWDELDSADPAGWTISQVDEIKARLVDHPTPDMANPEPQPLPLDEIVAAARSEGVDLDTPFDRFGRKPGTS